MTTIAGVLFIGGFTSSRESDVYNDGFEFRRCLLQLPLKSNVVQLLNAPLQERGHLSLVPTDIMIRRSLFVDPHA